MSIHYRHVHICTKCEVSMFTPVQESCTDNDANVATGATADDDARWTKHYGVGSFIPNKPKHE